MQETVETTSSNTNEKILISLFSIANEGKCSYHTMNKGWSRIWTQAILFLKSMSERGGDIDVGDGCWRPNVMVISLRCW